MQLLRTIAIIIIVYYGFKLLVRYVFPFLITRWANKKMQEFQQQAQNQVRDEEEAKRFVKQHEGEVKINSTKRSAKPESDDLGDYVDYEEVE